MKSPLTVEDVRRRAKRKLPRVIYDFIEGGAEDEAAVAGNRSAFERISLVPRPLEDVASRDLSVRVLGQDLDLPVILGPAGLARLAHADGEVGAAQAANAAGTAFTLSTGASASIEAVASSSSGPHWFQLYLWRDRGAIGELVDRAAAAGYRALCLTVDVPVIGRRERDLRNGMRIPPRITATGALDAARRLRWMRDLVTGPPITFENYRGIQGASGDSASDLGAYVDREMMNPGATWSDLAWLRERWDGPLIVKGILRGSDASRAADQGADAVVVSNHGGRQLDHAPPTIEVLPEVVEAVGDRLEVFLDGGVRRGTDVVKALGFGARAVLLGRPWFYGLGADGRRGVTAVLEILRGEIDRTMALLGTPTIADIDGSVVRARRWN